MDSRKSPGPQLIAGAEGDDPSAHRAWEGGSRVGLHAPGRPSGSSLRAAVLFAATLIPLTSQPARSQEGSAAAVVGAGALGAYSGAGLGLLGGLVPCSTTTHGLLCSRVAAGVGGVIGATSGVIIGNADQDFASRHLRNAGVGAFIGAGAGLVLQELVRQYGWLDAGAGALIGGAIGAAPRGAGIGAGVGAVVGVSLWAVVPRVEPGDAVALTLLGVAVGGVTQWVLDAAKAGESPTGPIPVPLFSIGLP